jgi:hypothetical protein
MLNAVIKIILPAVAAVSLIGAQQPTNLGSDANGNPRRLAVKTGHVSNYDEARVPPYTLPDPLVLANGQPVKDARAWRTARRPRSFGSTRRRSSAALPPDAEGDVAVARDGARQRRRQPP